MHYEFCGHWTLQCPLFPEDLLRLLSFCMIHLEAMHSSFAEVVLLTVVLLTVVLLTVVLLTVVSDCKL